MLFCIYLTIMIMNEACVFSFEKKRVSLMSAAVLILGCEKTRIIIEFIGVANRFSV